MYVSLQRVNVEFGFIWLDLRVIKQYITLLESAHGTVVHIKPHIWDILTPFLQIIMPPFSSC